MSERALFAGSKKKSVKISKDNVRKICIDDFATKKAVYLRDRNG
jgi:hypothetical protein